MITPLKRAEKVTLESEIFIGRRTYGPEKVVLDGTYKIPRFELME